MSRSYKRNPVMKYAPIGGRIGKVLANKRVRRFKDNLSNGCSYRKIYNPWDIHDCVTRFTLNEQFKMWAYWKEVEERDGYSRDYYGRTLHDCIKNWKKQFYWK